MLFLKQIKMKDFFFINLNIDVNVSCSACPLSLPLKVTWLSFKNIFLWIYPHPGVLSCSMGS